ncbi:MAG: hypothetical protein QUU85_11575, partial [Candidatus Eisenbacteria bacterium]|nr:hypothetical protein [Candidatus Eisenbacteria bacterium]
LLAILLAVLLEIAVAIVPCSGSSRRDRPTTVEKREEMRNGSRIRLTPVRTVIIDDLMLATVITGRSAH